MRVAACRSHVYSFEGHQLHINLRFFLEVVGSDSSLFVELVDFPLDSHVLFISRGQFNAHALADVAYLLAAETFPLFKFEHAIQVDVSRHEG